MLMFKFLLFNFSFFFLDPYNFLASFKVNRSIINSFLNNFFEASSNELLLSAIVIPLF